MAKQEKVEIEIIRPTRIAGKSVAKKDRVQVEKLTADHLIGMGKAKIATPKKAAANKTAPPSGDGKGGGGNSSKPVTENKDAAPLENRGDEGA